MRSLQVFINDTAVTLGDNYQTLVERGGSVAVPTGWVSIYSVLGHQGDKTLLDYVGHVDLFSKILTVDFISHSSTTYFVSLCVYILCTKSCLTPRWQAVFAAFLP